MDNCQTYGEKAVKLLIFDMGGVIIRDFGVVDKMASLLGIPLEDLKSEYRHYDFPLMDGVVSEESFLGHLEQVFHIEISGNPLKTLFTPVLNMPVVNLIGKLRSTHPELRIVCGSNTIDSHWSTLQFLHWTSLFDSCYASHLMGVSKPLPEFFIRILDSEHVKPEEAVFVDDYEENLIGASHVGITAIQYFTPKSEDVFDETSLDCALASQLEAMLK